MLLSLVVEKCIMMFGGSKVIWNLLRYSDLELENVQNSKIKEQISNWHLMISILAQIAEKQKNTYLGIFLMSQKMFDSLTKLTLYNENTKNCTLLS